MSYAQQRLAALGVTPQPRVKRTPKPASLRNPLWRYAHMTAHDHELMRALAAGGMDYDEIAEKFECSRSYVGRVVRFEVST